MDAHQRCQDARLSSVERLRGVKPMPAAKASAWPPDSRVWVVCSKTARAADTAWRVCCRLATAPAAMVLYTVCWSG